MEFERGLKIGFVGSEHGVEHSHVVTPLTQH